MNRLIVWRHGESEWNALGRVQGQADIDLSEAGRRQAAVAAERLSVLRPRRIVASDLTRAARTAAALAAVTGLQVTYDPRLRERFYGPWQGLTMAEIAQRWPAEHARWVAGEPTVGLGIETLDDLAKRGASALVDACEDLPGEEGGVPRPGAGPGADDDVVVVATHGGTARQGCGELLGWSSQVIRTLGGLGNCRWSELRRHPVRGWCLWSHNGSIE